MSTGPKEHLTSAEVRQARRRLPDYRIRPVPVGLERITPTFLNRFDVETDLTATTTFMDSLRNREAELFDIYTSRLYELFGRTKNFPPPEPPFEEADYRLALVWSQRLFDNNPKINNMEILHQGVIEALQKLDP